MATPDLRASVLGDRIDGRHVSGLPQPGASERHHGVELCSRLSGERQQKDGEHQLLPPGGRKDVVTGWPSTHLLGVRFELRFNSRHLIHTCTDDF